MFFHDNLVFQCSGFILKFSCVYFKVIRFLFPLNFCRIALNLLNFNFTIFVFLGAFASEDRFFFKFIHIGKVLSVCQLLNASHWYGLHVRDGSKNFLLLFL